MSEEIVEIGGKLYPKWVVEKTKRLSAELGNRLSLEQAIKIVARGIEAQRNSTSADPDNPQAVIPGGGTIFLFRKEKSDG